MIILKCSFSFKEYFEMSLWCSTIHFFVLCHFYSNFSFSNSICFDIISWFWYIFFQGSSLFPFHPAFTHHDNTYIKLYMVSQIFVNRFNFCYLVWFFCTPCCTHICIFNHYNIYFSKNVNQKEIKVYRMTNKFWKSGKAFSSLNHYPWTSLHIIGLNWDRFEIFLAYDLLV